MDYTYEIDHHIPLFKGGSNDISNLIALCRNCHGKKTILENVN
jgi:5-methylcytosine-specific restriction endonuclease McrA